MENERQSTDPTVVRESGERSSAGLPRWIDYTPEYYVGRNTRRLREERGWSQGELGRRMAGYGFDLHQTTVAKLENGSRPIRLNEVAALAEVFGVSVAELISDSPETPGLNQDELAVALRDVRRFEAQVFDAEREVDERGAAATHAQTMLAQAVQRLADLRAQLAHAEAELKKVSRRG